MLKHLGLLFFIICSFRGHSFEIDIQGIEGELNSGMGEVAVSSLDLKASPIGTKLSNFDATFYSKDDQLNFDFDGQKITLDLGVYKKIFEKQIFYLNDGNIKLKQGISLGLDFTNLIFGLEKINVDLRVAELSCRRANRRGFGDEVVQLCLDEGRLSLSSLDLGLFMKNLKSLMMPYYVLLSPPGTIFPQSIIPSINNLVLNIDDGDFNFQAVTKMIFELLISSDGTTEYDRNEEALSVILNNLKIGKVSFKKAVLFVLDKLDDELLRVEGDTVTLFLKKLRNLGKE